MEFEAARRRIPNPNGDHQSLARGVKEWLLTQTGKRREHEGLSISPGVASNDNATMIGGGAENEEGIERIDIAERQYGIRRVRPEDISFIARWFRYAHVRDQIYDETVNPHIPRSWRNTADVEKFHKALAKFLIPKGSITMETKIPYVEGSPKPKNHEVTVNRTAKIALTIEKDERGRDRWIPVGVQCWLDNDPYAPQEDRDLIDAGELRVAYGHFMIVDPGYQEKGVALYLTTARADMLLSRSPEESGKFHQISTLVKRASGTSAPMWGKVLEFFLRFGYDFDRRPEGRSVIPLGESNGTFDRMLITGNDYWKRSRDAALEGLNQKDIKYKYNT